MIDRLAVRTFFTSALAAAMAFSSSLQAIAQSVASDATRATAFATQIERSLMAIEDGRRQAPRDRWDPQYVVDTFGIDPAALYSFVRDNVAWVPYRGMLRGPVGVLMDRTGNSLDMSLLLADLFSRTGRQVRLAHATLDPVVLDRLWADFEVRVLASRVTPPGDKESFRPGSPANELKASCLLRANGGRTHRARTVRRRSSSRRQRVISGLPAAPDRCLARRWAVPVPCSSQSPEVARAPSLPMTTRPQRSMSSTRRRRSRSCRRL